MITLLVQIRMDRILVLAKMDILEMVPHVKVSVYVLMYFCTCYTNLFYLLLYFYLHAVC